MEEVYRETFPDLEIRICQIGETACNTQWKTGLNGYLKTLFYFLPDMWIAHLTELL